ncbi:hypothetical protein HMPREF0005_06006, partial [Achromobacter xylosoxidans C54]
MNPVTARAGLPAPALPLAITMGDPAGIGPEIVARTLLRARYAQCCVVVGDAGVMARALAPLGAAARLRVVEDVAGIRAGWEAGEIRLLPSSRMPAPPPFGRIDAAAGQAAYQAICLAIDLARQGRVAGRWSRRRAQEALAAAGVPYPATPRSW